MCSDSRTRNPYRMRNAATCEDIRAAYNSTSPPISPQKAIQPQRIMPAPSTEAGLAPCVSSSFNTSYTAQ